VVPKAARLGVQDMPVAVGEGESERRYLGRGEAVSYVLFSDTYEENGLTDGGFIDLLALNIDQGVRR